MVVRVVARARWALSRVQRHRIEMADIQVLREDLLDRLPGPRNEGTSDGSSSGRSARSYLLRAARELNATPPSMPFLDPRGRVLAVDWGSSGLPYVDHPDDV